MGKNKIINESFLVQSLDQAMNNRLDLFLLDHFQKKNIKVSRNLIKKMIDASSVLVNQKPVKCSTKLKEGDLIFIEDSVFENQMIKTKLIPKLLSLDILYEDEDIIVINKQAGLTVHPGASTAAEETTLVEGLLAHGCTLSTFHENPLRPGIVHRLDKNTTGVMVCAKNIFSHKSLAAQFAEKSNKREYFALLEGYLDPSPQTVESILKRHPTKRTLFQSTPLDKSTYPPEANNSGGKYAHSRFERFETFENYLTLAKVTLKTGRTHQIRLHSQQINCPIVGDPTYNYKKLNELPGNSPIKVVLKGVHRQMLHAHLLGFKHPQQAKNMVFSAPMPGDFAEILSKLRSLINKNSDDS